MCHKTDNVILVGLIHGPHEPQHNINTFLEPLVDELMEFWEGCELNVHSYAAKKVVCCMLLCCAYDLPAVRKACGFLGHSANLGCSRCLKKFSGSVGSMDYSGFDRDQWILRNGTDHRKHSLSLLKCCTKSQLELEESKHGCRYSVLMKLPYFNAPPEIFW